MEKRTLTLQAAKNIALSTLLFAIFVVVLYFVEKHTATPILLFQDPAFNIGLAASIIGVGYTLTIRNPQNYIGFYFGILMSLLLATQFYLNALYDQMLLYLLVFVPFQARSLMLWMRPKEGSKSFEPAFLTTRARTITLLVFAAICIANYLYITYLQDCNTLGDDIAKKLINSIVIASSALANFWLIYKKHDAWIFWVVYSVAGILQGSLVLHNPFNTLLCVLFLIINSMAAYSWISNDKRKH